MILELLWLLAWHLKVGWEKMDTCFILSIRDEVSEARYYREVWWHKRLRIKREHLAVYINSEAIL